MGEAEVTMCPFPDPAEACSVWRQQQLKEFKQKAKQLGLEDDPQFQDMFNTILKENYQLDDILEKQKDGTSTAPWWADGEYDSVKADRSNDLGTEAFKETNYTKAFDLFTDAIRLCPVKAVYHCNRAATALKLGRSDIALKDAEYALEREPKYEKAMLKAGDACLNLGKLEEAAGMFEAVLSTNTTSKAGLIGARKVAMRILEDNKKSKLEDEERQKGTRPGLPLKLLPEQDAVDLLYSAREMLRIHPNLEAARCSEVEALLHCQRLDDAAEAANHLQDGVDGLYLQAECSWRRGDVQMACCMLDDAMRICPENYKCKRLKLRLEAIKLLEADVNAATEDGSPPWKCIERIDKVLGVCEECSCSGLVSRFLRRRAELFCSEHNYEAAKDDLTNAAKLSPNSIENLMSLAMVLGLMGLYDDSFFQLCKIQRLDPKTPGLLENMQTAAAQCQRNRSYKDPKNWGMTYTESGPGYYNLLGVKPSASQREIKQAYHKLAAQWHPDKWATRASDEQMDAEATFKKIREAYDTLSNDQKRSSYDSAHLV